MPSTPSTCLLDLPDDLLLQIVPYLIHPSDQRPSPSTKLHPRPLTSVRPVVALAATCTRLRYLFCSPLPTPLHLDLADTRCMPPALPAALARVLSASLTHASFRASSYPPSLLLSGLATLRPPLRKLDLTNAVAPASNALHGLLCAVGPTLQTLLLRRVQVPGRVLQKLTTLCPQLTALDLTAVPALSDAVVVAIARSRLANTLRHLLIGGNVTLTDGVAAPVAAMQLVSLSLRTTCVSDAFVRVLMTGPIVDTLRTLDVLDCPRVTVASLRVLPDSLFPCGMTRPTPAPTPAPPTDAHNWMARMYRRRPFSWSWGWLHDAFGSSVSANGVEGESTQQQEPLSPTPRRHDKAARYAASWSHFRETQTPNSSSSSLPSSPSTAGAVRSLAVALLRSYVRAVRVDADGTPATAVVVLDVATVAPFDAAVASGRPVDIAAFDAGVLVVDRAVTRGDTLSQRARVKLAKQFGISCDE